MQCASCILWRPKKHFGPLSEVSVKICINRPASHNQNGKETSASHPRYRIWFGLSDTIVCCRFRQGMQVCPHRSAVDFKPKLDRHSNGAFFRNAVKCRRHLPFFKNDTIWWFSTLSTNFLNGTIRLFLLFKELIMRA